MAERDARNEELKRKLEARDSDLRMMEELLEQKNRLVRDLELEKADPLSKDIAAFFGGDEAPATGAAPATASASASAGKDEQRESDPETPAAAVVAGSPGLGNDIDMYFKQGTTATTTTATAATPAAASPPAPPTTATVRPHPRL